MSRRRHGSKRDPAEGSIWFPDKGVWLRVHCSRNDRRLLGWIEWAPVEGQVRVLSATGETITLVTTGDRTRLRCPARSCRQDWQCLYERMVPALAAAAEAFPEGGEWWMRTAELDRLLLACRRPGPPTGREAVAELLGGPFAPRVVTGVKGPGS